MFDSGMFFAGWTGLGRTIVVGVMAYLSVVVLLRLSGNRTLSKMNAFDLIETVALGSTLATVLLSKDVALAEGLVALGVLIGLQYGITWLSVRSDSVSQIVKSEPKLLLYRGQLLREQMRAARVVAVEVEAAVREQGIASLSAVDAVVLETDGTFSVVRGANQTIPSTLSGLVEDCELER